MHNSTANKLPSLNISGSNLQDFHDQDIKRVRDDDHWLSCFLKSRKQEVNDALQALVSCEMFGNNVIVEFMVKFC